MIIYFKIIFHILYYLKVIYNYYIIYKKLINVSIFNIIDYSDTNFINDENDRKFYTDYIFLINDDIITWLIYKQSTIKFSSMKSKYIILSDIIREILT